MENQREQMEFFENFSDMILLINKKTGKIVERNRCARNILHTEEEKQIIWDVIANQPDHYAEEKIGKVVYQLNLQDCFWDPNLWMAIGHPKHGWMAGIENHAVFDRVTGLATVDYFYEMAGEMIQNKKDGVSFAFVYFDVNNFKAFNSEYGFENGDLFLHQLADLISQMFPEYIVGRTSNDHFIVLSRAKDLEQRIEKVHKQTHALQKNIKMELRAGIYLYEEGVSVAQAHDRAKLACDAQRNTYDCNYRYYDKELKEQILREKYIVDNLETAIEKEYLVIHYQPVQRVLSDQVCGMESLVRWNDPVLGFLPPIQFIPILEKRHLIHKLDQYVLEHVCRDLRAMQLLGETIIPVSVNLSRMDFQLMDVFEMVNSTVKKYGISPELIHLEVTESALNQEMETLIGVLGQLRSAGFEIWLDDFGSEYSSLNSLQNYQFDLLKIDMKFFQTFETNENSRIIIASITDMAKRLHIRILAEGIETPEQYGFLKQIGCDKAQGFYVCKPMPLDSLYGKCAEMETKEEADYYSSIGKVNFFSPTPLADGKEKFYNLTPTAIIQYEKNEFHYLYANSGFLECLAEIGTSSLEKSEEAINRDYNRMKERLEGIAQKCHDSQQMERFDFIFHGQHLNLQVKEIARRKGMQAFFVTAINLNTLDNARRMNKIDYTMKFLYSIYSRVDLIDVDADTIENIYLSSHYYHTTFNRKAVEKSIQEYVLSDITAEDRERFLEFYEMSTLDARIKKCGKGYIAKSFRTMTQKDGIQLQLYAIIQINDGRSIQYLSCVRDMAEVESGEMDRRFLPMTEKATEWYELLCQEFQASILEWDKRTGETFVSGRGYQYALCHEDMKDILHNRASMDAVYPEDFPLAFQFFEESDSQKRRAEIVLRLKMTDGSYRWSRIIGLFEYDENGAKVHATGIILDAEEGMNTLEQVRFLNQMPTAIGVFEVQNGNTRQLFMNDEYFRLLGDLRENRSRNHKTFFDGIHPDDRVVVRRAMKQVIDGESRCSEVCRVETGSGAYKWIRFTSSVAKRDSQSLLVYSTYVDAESEMQNRMIRSKIGS